jgi:CHASE3 domain sensor protein
LAVALSAATIIVLMAFLNVVIRNVDQTRSLRQESDRVMHTLEVQRALDSVLYHASEGDSAARGFLLAGEETTLADYKVAQHELEKTIRGLEDLTRDSAPQQDRLGKLKVAVATRFNRLDRAIVVRRAEGRDAAIASARADESDRPRTEIRAIAQAMEQH